MKQFSRLWRRNTTPRKGRYRPVVEQLDDRRMMSVFGGSPVLEIEPNDTLDVAQQLGNPSLSSRVAILGTVGNGAAGRADVDWYVFQLESTARVALGIAGTDASSQPIFRLYNSNPDPYDFSDPFAVSGHRLLGQTAEFQTQGGLEVDLAAGTYYLAVSGSGNSHFHPFLAGSGAEGRVGAYQLFVEAAPFVQNAGDGPLVLASNPLPGAALASSPLVLRLNFNASLDPGTISPGANVRLIYNATGAFGDGTDEEVLLGTCNYSPALMELQLMPAAPLKPGSYQILLAGDSSVGGFVLADPSGIPLGTDGAHPFGQDYSTTFTVTGIEGQTGPQAGANDTAPFAHDLGELTSNTLVQVSGAVGDDPYYDPNHPDLVVNPSADVDMVHFHISGLGTYAFAAEVFAGRFGSPLDPGVSLFRLDPATGQLVFLDGNNDTSNPTLATNGTLPLHGDSVLFFGLTEGDYYVAVTSNYNTPTRVPGFEPGTNGIFDPNVSHSGAAGFSTGPYVLNFMIQPDNEPPTVVSTSIADSETLTSPPTSLEVRFSEPMNVRQLFALAFNQNTQATVAAVSLQDSNGAKYFPRLESYDVATNTARFLMLDGLANGVYTLHLSGANGLTDLAGHPLTGNDPSGDYVVLFEVDGAPRGLNGDPLHWLAQEPNDSLTEPQHLGVLFPHELQTGVIVTRDVAVGASDSADYFEFQVLQETHVYTFNLSGLNLPDGVQISVTDWEGNPVPYNLSDGRSLIVPLKAGTYLVRVDGWTLGQAELVSYDLRIQLQGDPDNPPALTTGPAPALNLRQASSDSPVFPSAPQVVVLPAQGNGVTLSTPGENRVVLVSFTAPSGVGQQVSLVVPGGVLQQLGRTPLGGVPGTDVTASRGVTERLVFVTSVTSVSVTTLANSTTSIFLADAVTDPPGSVPIETASFGAPLGSQLLNERMDARELIRDFAFSGQNPWNGVATSQASPAPLSPSETATPREVAQSNPVEATQEESVPPTASGQSPSEEAVASDVPSTGFPGLSRVAAWIAAAAAFVYSVQLARKERRAALAAPLRVFAINHGAETREELHRELLS